MRERLRAAREALGWTMEQAAENLLISLSHYGKLEHEKRSPGVHLAKAINNTFGQELFKITQWGVTYKED